MATLLLAAALGGCESAPPGPARPTDAALDLSNTTARLEFDQGQPAQAAISYAQALDRARQMDDAAAVTTAAYNLAIARAASADYAGAMAALDEAGHEVRRTDLDPVDILLVRGRVALANGDPAEASRAAAAVLAEPRSKPTPARQVQAHVIKGLAACRSADGAGARRELAAAQALSADQETAPVVGLGGEIALLAKDYPAAAAAFDRQADLCRRASDYRTLCRALAKAGRAFAAAGRPDVAADHLYRAARAAVAGNDRDAARLTAEAAAAARAAGDASLVHLTDLLAARLGPASRPASKPASQPLR